MTQFALHPRLDSDTRLIGDLPLCRLLLMDDRRFPWCILVPRRNGLRELHELPSPDQSALMQEISRVSLALMEHCVIDKLNVGALGNLVPQLHVHVIGRRHTDDAWPGPVWGHGQALHYENEEASRRIEVLGDACGVRFAR
jgi:diadenosine tetraphosphate (Ap4A) HIT family hydrolase